jgi:hypothetical protein
MALLEEITLTHSIEIRTTPEKIFEFLLHIVDEKKLDHGLASARKHMKEEGENLKRILESGSLNQPDPVTK